MDVFRRGLAQIGRGPGPMLTQAQALALRDELARLAAPDALEPAPSIVRLPREILRTLDGLSGLLAGAESLSAEDLDARFGPPYAAIVGVERLGALRELGGDLAERVAGELTHRILAHIPGADLRRVGRSTLEFTFRARDPEDVAARMRALLKALERRVSLDGGGFDLTVAIGYAEGSAGLRQPEHLIELADLALARARTGPLKLALFNAAAQAERADRLALMRDLRSALDTEAIFLCYQPKLDARTGEVACAEALIRWRHPERGMVAPDLFIALAEQTGEIRTVTERVIERALADQSRLRRAGTPMAVHVNVSGALIGDPRFAAWTLERAAQAVDPLGIEITETAFIAEPERAVAHLHAFADAGIEIAIDDYGSGLSSLAYLKTLPAHELKIDKVFIQGLTVSTREALIVRSTIELAHALGMKVTAEGVEDAACQALLTTMGCDLLQGYGISPPLPAPAFSAFLKARTARTPALRQAG